jgi:hypothetical protein
MSVDTRNIGENSSYSQLNCEVEINRYPFSIVFYMFPNLLFRKAGSSNERSPEIYTACKNTYKGFIDFMQSLHKADDIENSETLNFSG